MSDTLAGLLTLRHADGTIDLASIKGQSYTHEAPFTVDDLVVGGVVIAQAASKPMQTLSFEGVFAASSTPTFTHPNPLAIATVSGLPTSGANGTYNYLGCTITGAEGANVKASFKLGKPAAGALTPL